MLDKRAAEAAVKASGPPLDLHEHLRRLEAEGLLLRIDRAIDKDSELHPLVRWQFQGGLREDERRAFTHSAWAGRLMRSVTPGCAPSPIRLRRRE